MKFNPRLGLFLLALIAAAGAAAASPPAAAELAARGFAALEQRDFFVARRAFEQALEVSAGGSYEAQLGLATALLKGDRPAAAATAAAAAEKLAASGAQRAAAANLLGLALYADGDPALLEPAAMALQRAIGLDPRAAAPARIALARVREATGDPAAAVGSLRDAIAALPAGSRVGAEARIQLCGIRGRHPETADDSVLLATRALGDFREPRELYAPVPPYPAAAREARIAGGVAFEAVIDRDGCVGEITGDPDFQPELAGAVATMRTWVFQPATLNGEPVAALTRLHASFGLANPDRQPRRLGR